MNKSLINAAILALELKRPIEYHEHKRIIRKQLDNKSFKAIGYYTLAYKEKIGQYHRIDYCTKVHDINEVIIHELIHAWQAENFCWNYGHGQDFEIMVEHLADILEMDVEDIIPHLLLKELIMYIMLMLGNHRAFMGETVESCVNQALEAGYIENEKEVNTDAEIEFYKLPENPINVTVDIKVIYNVF